VSKVYSKLININLQVLQSYSHRNESVSRMRRLAAPVLFLSLLTSLNCSNDNVEYRTDSRVPLLNKIVVVIGENEKPGSVIGDPSAPYINFLAANGALFINSFAIEHPSQPNYLDLISGSNQEILDDLLPLVHFTTPNLADELIKSGKIFATFSEDMPFAGFDSLAHGLYVRKHNPIANWMGSGDHQVPLICNLTFKDFPQNFLTLPDVSFVIPNLCNDGHDPCSPYFNRTKQFDLWVQNNLNSYREWCTSNNSLLIVTFDEDDKSGDNRISTVFYGAKVNPGTYADPINHFTVLRTLEESMNLHSHAGQAASAKPINSCWK